EVRKVSGVDTLTPDETGLVSIRVDDAYNVNLQFVEATGKILCFVEVTERKRQMSEMYDRLMADMKTAMKEHDMVAVNAIRGVIAKAKGPHGERRKGNGLLPSKSCSAVTM
ncbi:MAG: hypothetical protein IKO72_07165, partial [Kiritimatiellae bacterium]|nr:hypothetical protein [Kiritimatiellia bacterium]